MAPFGTASSQNASILSQFSGKPCSIGSAVDENDVFGSLVTIAICRQHRPAIARASRPHSRAAHRCFASAPPAMLTSRRPHPAALDEAGVGMGEQLPHAPPPHVPPPTLSSPPAPPLSVRSSSSFGSATTSSRSFGGVALTSSAATPASSNSVRFHEDLRQPAACPAPVVLAAPAPPLFKVDGFLSPRTDFSHQ